MSECEGMDFGVGDPVSFNTDFENKFMVNEGEIHRTKVAKGQVAFLVSYPWYGIASVRVPEPNSKKFAVIEVPSHMLSPLNA
jgi:hypothetical protein